MLPDPWVTIEEMRLFCSLDRKMLTSPGRVQMTTLVSVGSSGLEIIKKGGAELIINEPLLIKNISFLMLLNSIRLLL